MTKKKLMPIKQEKESPLRDNLDYLEKPST
jgi:hypothetical protein